MHKTISMSDLLADMARVVNEVETLGTQYKIRQPGKRKLIAIDKHYLERLRATIEFETAHPNWREEFAQTDRDLEAGLCPTLDDIMRQRRDRAALQSKRRPRARVRARGSRAKIKTGDSNGRGRPSKRPTLRPR